MSRIFVEILSIIILTLLPTWTVAWLLIRSKWIFYLFFTLNFFFSTNKVVKSEFVRFEFILGTKWESCLGFKIWTKLSPVMRKVVFMWIELKGTNEPEKRKKNQEKKFRWFGKTGSAEKHRKLLVFHQPRPLRMTKIFKLHCLSKNSRTKTSSSWNFMTRKRLSKYFSFLSFWSKYPY